MILVILLSIYLLFYFFAYTHLNVDWNAISEGKLELTVFQKFTLSKLSYWCAFLFPLLISFLTNRFRIKSICASM